MEEPLKVYLDNVIVSGKARGDLKPPAEMDAVRTLAKADEEGRIEVYTSRWSWAEQDRTHDDFVRAQLREARGEIEVVPQDHTLLRIVHVENHLGTVSNNPVFTPIVDESLFSGFKKVGLEDADARHLMYAVHNSCDRFVTLDPDFLDRRSQLAPLCRGTRIVKPSELAAEL
jgi:predicted nucleic acid-binding protein